jgi:hypothetical protein
MIAVLVTFTGPDHDRAAKVAHESRAVFEGMPGLHSKAFTYDEVTGRAINLYIWHSEEAARGFFTPELTARVTGLYGVEPTVEYIEMLELVENT